MTVVQSVKFESKATKAENLAEANRWLDNAIRYEAEGKSVKIIDIALNRACQYEAVAVGMTA